MTIGLLFTACAKDEIDKIYNSDKSSIDLVDGKNESTISESGKTFADKNQTRASDSDLIKLHKLLQNRYYKTTTKANEVGVIREGSCGNYATLEIRMDCEDELNASFINSNGWNGDIIMDSKGNMTFYYCLVPNNFKRLHQGHFGVLATNLGAYEIGVTLWDRTFDTEDDNNINYAKLGPNSITSYGPNMFTYSIPGKVPGEDMRLFFAYYPFKDNILEFPYYGIEYSVFGSIAGYSHAEVQTDDEDTDCFNTTFERNHTTSGTWLSRGYDPYSGMWGQPAVAVGCFNFDLLSLSQFHVIKVY